MIDFRLPVIGGHVGRPGRWPGGDGEDPIDTGQPGDDQAAAALAIDQLLGVQSKLNQIIEARVHNVRSTTSSG